MSTPRYSPLHDEIHASTGAPYPRAVWTDIDGMAVACHLDDAAREVEIAKTLALADVSFLPRIVIKGPRAAELLRGIGAAIPDAVFSTAPLDGDGLLIRTGGSEFFLEDGLQGSMVRRVQQLLAAGTEPGVYAVLRQDAALVLAGHQAGALLRHVSSYDFVSQPHNDVVFTPIAGVSCSVLRQSTHGVFRLWTDGTYGLYTWHALLEIVTEMGGSAVGAAVFFPAISQAKANRP